jgi:hypothetical protein
MKEQENERASDMALVDTWSTFIMRALPSARNDRPSIGRNAWDLSLKTSSEQDSQLIASFQAPIWPAQPKRALQTASRPTRSSSCAITPRRLSRSRGAGLSGHCKIRLHGFGRGAVSNDRPYRAGLQKGQNLAGRGARSSAARRPA